MSDFNQSSHDFQRFVQQLTEGSSHNDLLFEETIFYVHLPDLNTFKRVPPHVGVRDLFSWLKGRGVETIKNLSIPDSTTHPMSDALVSEAIIQKFKIEKFDWRKLDVNLDILTDARYSLPESLTDLKLYSSGNWSVLYHWASKDGLIKLKKVCDLPVEEHGCLRTKTDTTCLSNPVEESNNWDHEAQSFERRSSSWLPSTNH
jgi:hypothetical protein